MNDDKVERTTSLAVTSNPRHSHGSETRWRGWFSAHQSTNCSMKITLSQSFIELLLRHYWWHICLGDEQGLWSISVEQGSWSESLQQEVIWLADFKTYTTSFSSLQSFTKRLNVYPFLMRGYGMGLSHIKRCRWTEINVIPWPRNAFCYQSTVRINTRRVQNPKNVIKTFSQNNIAESRKKKRHCPFREHTLKIIRDPGIQIIKELFLQHQLRMCTCSQKSWTLEQKHCK